VGNLADAIEFYVSKLGHELKWKTETAAGLIFPNSNSEFVLSTENGPETDLLVDDVPTAFSRLVAAGAKSVAPPFDIPVGKCAVLLDPWGNELTILDLSKGEFKMDQNKNVIR